MKDIPGLNKRYAITREGKVWSYPKGGKYDKGHVGRWLPTYTSKYGYRVVYLTPVRCKGPKHYFVHRLLMRTYVPNPLGLPDVNHMNGIKSDNRLENLEWCTKSHNSRHAFALGLNKGTPGEANYFAKLSAQQVARIRRLLDKGLRQKDIGLKFGVTQTTISKIKTGRNWGDYTPADNGEAPQGAQW
jgi:hypothetical protein